MITKLVTVTHDGQVAPAALVAALNEARLDASLTQLRVQQSTGGWRTWLPPWNGASVKFVLVRSCCDSFLVGCNTLYLSTLSTATQLI